MRFLLVFTFLIGSVVCKGGYLKPASDKDSIKKAKGLVKNKKYNSAFKLLESIDIDNQKPQVVLLKEDIALDYFVESISHQMFALRDLNANENIEDFRGKEGTNDMYQFEIDKVLKKLIKQFPTDYKLYLGLGQFYESAYEHYQGRWLISDDSLINLIRKNYQIAIDHEVADFHAYFRVAVDILQGDKAYRKAAQYLQKSYNMNPNFPDASYNLAYAYMYCNSEDSALMYAKISIKEYKEPSMKSDAERMTGEIYTEMKDTNNAVKYYEMANMTDPNEYENLKSLLNIYVVTNDSKRTGVLNSFFKLDPKNPTIYNDLSDIYVDSIKGYELVAFYKSKIPLYIDKNKTLGSLYFYLAQLYLRYDKQIAKDYALKAKDIFTKVFDKNNQVFVALDKLINMADESKGDKK